MQETIYKDILPWKKWLLKIHILTIFRQILTKFRYDRQEYPWKYWFWDFSENDEIY